MVGFNGDRFKSPETHVAVACANDQRARHGAIRIPVGVPSINSAPKSSVDVTRMACECNKVVAFAVAGLESEASNPRKRELAVRG